MGSQAFRCAWPVSLVLTNELTPLIGLKSFRFQPAPIMFSQQGGQLVLRWSAGDGTVNYDLEEASALDRPDAWRPSSMRPVLDRQDFDSWWIVDWVVTNELTRPASFYRIRLLNP